jgi:hypothetical protein
VKHACRDQRNFGNGKEVVQDKVLQVLLAKTRLTGNFHVNEIWTVGWKYQRGHMFCFPAEKLMLVACIFPNVMMYVLDSWDDMFVACLELSKCHEVLDSWDDMFLFHVSKRSKCHDILDNWDSMTSILMLYPSITLLYVDF